MIIGVVVLARRPGVTPGNDPTRATRSFARRSNRVLGVVVRRPGRQQALTVTEARTVFFVRKRPPCLDEAQCFARLGGDFRNIDPRDAGRSLRRCRTLGMGGRGPPCEPSREREEDSDNPD